MTTAPTLQMLQMILYLMCTKCLITFCQLLLEQILCLVSAYIALHLILYELYFRSKRLYNEFLCSKGLLFLMVY